ncbi:hypothetical protein NFJ02_32g82330 [Pycnococcus provasolii]
MYASQHPSDCSNARFLVTCVTHGVGLGTDIHFWTMALAAAASHDRVLVFLEDADVMQWTWRDGVECVDGRSDCFKCYFNDLTGCKPEPSELQGLSCRADTYSSASALEAALASDERIVVFGPSSQLGFRADWHGRLPPPFRDDEHTKFEELELYRAVAVEFLFHNPANWLRKLVCDSWSEVYGFEDAPSPDELVTVHIRGGDKHMEMKLLDVEEYAQAVETLQKRHASLQQRMSVYLVTESQEAEAAFREFSKRRGWHLITNGKGERIESFDNHKAIHANEQKRVGMSALISLYLSLHARYYVLTTRSNWSLLIDELRRSRVKPSCGGKCTDVIDLTDPAVGLGFPRRTEWADLRQRVVATRSGMFKLQDAVLRSPHTSGGATDPLSSRREEASASIQHAADDATTFDTGTLEQNLVNESKHAPCLVFHHIPKAGGLWTARKIMRALGSNTSSLQIYGQAVDRDIHNMRYGPWKFAHGHWGPAAPLKRNCFRMTVLREPLEAILAHRRLPGRGLNYELTVKYVDRPIDFQPNKISLKDALVKGAATTRAYFAKWNLGNL